MPDLSTITPVTRLEEFIDRISRESGGGLPEVTADDDGKVLTVVDGAWAAAPAGGGDSDFSIVTVTLTSEFTGDPFTVIAPNIYNGQSMECLIDSGDMDGSDFDVVLYKGTYTAIVDSTGDISTLGSSVTGDITKTEYGQFIITGDGTITFTDSQS